MPNELTGPQQGNENLRAPAFALMMTDNGIAIGKPGQFEQFYRLRLIARGEDDFDTAIPIVPNDRRKQRHVRRIIDVDPDRFYDRRQPQY